jgi:hypothetical protein
MEGKFCKVSTLLVAVGCVSMGSACLAQVSGKSALHPVLTNNVEYASADATDDSGNGAATAAPAPPTPAAAPAVTTEVVPGAAVSGAELRPAMVKELEAMKQRIAELEAELAASGATRPLRCRAQKKTSYRDPRCRRQARQRPSRNLCLRRPPPISQQRLRRRAFPSLMPTGHG